MTRNPSDPETGECRYNPGQKCTVRDHWPEPNAGGVEALAKVIYSEDHVWLRTVDGSPNSVSYDMARTILASDWMADVRREAAVDALTKAGDLWQTGEWSVLTEAVKDPSQPQRVIGAAQAVTGWLRRLAEHTKGAGS